MAVKPSGPERLDEAAPSWGIDVSKRWLDLAQWPEQRAWRVRNDAAGWATLVDRLTEDPPARIVLEGSGGYETGVVLALDAARHPPVVLNALVARRFAQSHGYLAKTDSVDALMLARFGAERRPTPRPIPSESARNLAALLAVRDDLVAARAATKNRLGQAADIARPYLEHHQTALTEEIAAVEIALVRVLASDVELAATVTLLTSVKGIGQLVATTLAVGLPELGHVSHKAIAALVGVAPFANDSGRTRGLRSIRGGRAKLRRALYLAVLTMIRWDPGTSVYYHRLRDRGKPAKVAIVACMNRLLGLLTVMLRTGLHWDALDVNQPGAAPVPS